MNPWNLEPWVWTAVALFCITVLFVGAITWVTIRGKKEERE